MVHQFIKQVVPVGEELDKAPGVIELLARGLLQVLLHGVGFVRAVGGHDLQRLARKVGVGIVARGADLFEPFGKVERCHGVGSCCLGDQRAHPKSARVFSPDI